jgi:hypothetical protein
MAYYPSPTIHGNPVVKITGQIDPLLGRFEAKHKQCTSSAYSLLMLVMHIELKIVADYQAVHTEL